MANRRSYYQVVDLSCAKRGQYVTPEWLEAQLNDITATGKRVVSVIYLGPQLTRVVLEIGPSTPADSVHYTRGGYPGD